MDRVLPGLAQGPGSICASWTDGEPACRVGSPDKGLQEAKAWTRAKESGLALHQDGDGQDHV